MAAGTVSSRARLEQKCARLFGRRRAIAVGRGTWALALILQAIAPRTRRRLIALPSFLCHTPLAAVLYAGWTPLFCDVDPATGLVPDTEWSAAIDLGADTVLLVHLFGNPAPVDALAARCRAKNVFLIEDACQALGASVHGRPCGAHGDASILSFGHTKTIDAGSGGLLMTDDDFLADSISEALSHQRFRPDAEYAAHAAEFSRRFYEAKALSLGERDQPSVAFHGLIREWLPLVPAPWTADADDISRRLDSLPQVAAERRRKNALYLELLADAPIAPVPMAEGAAPWRFCFRLPGIERSRQEAISTGLRTCGIHVSNWYLPTHWMAPETVRSTGALSHTDRLAAEAFQLWLDGATGDRQIRANAQAFRESLPV